jgi:hypothetical protein
MSAFCTRCGARLSGSQKICTSCGATLAGSNEPATLAEASQSAAATPSVVLHFGRARAILVASLVIAGVALAAALIVIGPKAPQSPPASSRRMAPPANPTATAVVPPNTAIAPPVAVAAPPAGSGPTAIVAKQWASYVNYRYGVIIEYPADLFEIQPPPPDNAGRDFIADKVGARFFVYSHANALDASLQDLQEEDVLDIGDRMAVKNNGADWYQVTATKGTDTILRRVALSEGGSMVHRLEIAYPKAASAAFEPIVARMIKTFRVDPTIPEKAADAANAAASPAAPTSPATPLLPRTPAESTAAPPPATPSPPASPKLWQRFDSIALGLRVPDYSGKVGMSAEVPASWTYSSSTNSDRPEPNVIDFQGSEAAGDDVLHILFRAERRGSKATLANEAKKVKTQLAEGADNYRLVSERTTQVASRPAIVLSMQFAGSDSPALLREDVAIIDAGQVFYFVTFGAPEARYAASSNVFARVIETIGFVE